MDTDKTRQHRKNYLFVGKVTSGDLSTGINLSDDIHDAGTALSAESISTDAAGAMLLMIKASVPISDIVLDTEVLCQGGSSTGGGGSGDDLGLAWRGWFHVLANTMTGTLLSGVYSNGAECSVPFKGHGARESMSSATQEQLKWLTEHTPGQDQSVTDTAKYNVNTWYREGSTNKFAVVLTIKKNSDVPGAMVYFSGRISVAFDGPNDTEITLTNLSNRASEDAWTSLRFAEETTWQGGLDNIWTMTPLPAAAVSATSWTAFTDEASHN